MIFDKPTVLTTTTKIIILFLSLLKIPSSSFRVIHTCSPSRPQAMAHGLPDSTAWPFLECPIKGVTDVAVESGRFPSAPCFGSPHVTSSPPCLAESCSVAQMHRALPRL